MCLKTMMPFVLALAILLGRPASVGPNDVEKIDPGLANRDSNGNGVNDLVERLLGLDPAAPAKRKPDGPPYTSFQTPSGWREEFDLKTGAVIVYNAEKDRIQSWKDNGYAVQTMYGFRTGTDYIKAHPDEGQTDASGRILDCGPGSYYMVPTQSRIEAALAYFREAIKNGTSAVCPEEPEYFARSGYSESFKREWQAYYSEQWVDQTTSVEARYKSERLKAYLEWRMVKAILDDAKKQDPNVVRMVACHSPVSYYNWGIIYPHWQVLQLPELQEIIGQVWTGTARSACKYAGEMRERTFENGYLEYSSLFNQVHGTGKRLWFLMDPLEDNPDRTMLDYRTNYHQTLLASLMFPGIDAFEVMPWPDRIFGRVPDDFATEITTIIHALEDMHNQEGSSLDAGTSGIATFVADSMGWQRGAPHPSNMDGFYGLTLPLLMKGIPVQVIQLERAGQTGYLDQFKVLLLTYDILKPLKESYSTALAKWVRKGGVLVFFGGSDPYNMVPEWWRKKGLASPQEHLFAQLGLKITGSGVAPDEETASRRLVKIHECGLTKAIHAFDIPQGTRITYYSTEATALYSTNVPGKVVFEHPAGKGKLLFFGVEPSYFAGSAKAADMLRAITRYACGQAGVEYRDQGHLAVKRGRYLGVRTLGGTYSLEGKWVDLLDSSLPLVTKRDLPPWGVGLFSDVSDRTGKTPSLLFCGSKVEQTNEVPGRTCLFATGPSKVKGVARIWTAGRKLASADGFDSSGGEVAVQAEDQGDTILVRYDNKPKGVIVRLFWE